MDTRNYFLSLLSAEEPDAVAVIKGNALYSDINGIVKFYALPESGILIAVEISDLPDGKNEDTPTFFAFHIHENGDCSASFTNTGMHYNPDNVPHPEHAGDLPPLLSVRGRAFSAFLTDRFTVAEIVGRTVIIHGSPDDFKTQPGGDAGGRIACGVIRGIS